MPTLDLTLTFDDGEVIDSDGHRDQPVLSLFPNLLKDFPDLVSVEIRAFRPTSGEYLT